MSRFTLPFLGLGLVLVPPVPAQNVPVDPRLEIETVASGLSLPTTMAFIGPEEILVLEQDTGRVRRVSGGVLQAAPVLDVAVHHASERGLLGIAVHPDFLNQPFVYLFYTESPTGADTSSASVVPLGNRLYRYRWDGAALVDPLLLLDLGLSPGPHNSGPMRFGLDDRLYLVFGDLGRGNAIHLAGQLQNNAAGPPPDDTGVIFRLDAGGGVPHDNPFRDLADPGDPIDRYWAYGLRNSFGLAIDPVSGDLWQTENGPEDYDEVNHVVRGWNGGWMRIKGPADRDAEGVSDLWMPPAAVYGDPELSFAGIVAPAGIEFVASPVLGCDLLHDLIVGTTNCRHLLHFELDESRSSLVFTSSALLDRVVDSPSDPCGHAELDEIMFASGPPWGPRVTDIKNGPDGYLYFTAYSPGDLRRVVPVPGAVPDADADQVDDACDCDPADSGAFAEPLEVPRLRLSGRDPLRLGWDTQRATAGQGTSYTIVTGRLADLRASGGYGQACALATGLAVPAAADARDVAPGEGTYYLARAENGCGQGTYGDGRTVPDPRDALDPVSPPPCTPP